MKKKQKKTLIRIIISLILLISAIILPKSDFLQIVKTVLFSLSYLIVGYDILIKAIKGMFNGRFLDENFLMTVATLGAVGLGIYEKTYDFSEATSVMLLYQIGELFQSLAVNKSRKNIMTLMDIRPDYANVEKDGELIKVDPNEVEIGDYIVCKVGEKIPIDGIIVDGNTLVNTSSLTGESLPRSISVGDEILSGSINLSSKIKIKTTKKFSDSTVSKILELVENASSKKAKSEEFINRFAKFYTPTVCISALILALLPPIFNLILGNEANFQKWIYQALTFLVISCPCALVISIPLSFFAGIGGASRNGILIKGSNYFETLSNVKTVVFDKTGTLTKGNFEVSGIHHSKIENELLLEYASLAESASTHPISKSLISAYGKELDQSRISKIEEYSGLGVFAVIDGKNILVGNDKLMKKYGITFIDCSNVGTIVHVAIENEYMGHIVISDVIKETAKEAISELKNNEKIYTVMLTGDSKSVASHVASEIGIDLYKCELLPNEKVIELEKLLGNNTLAFVGDGINDAPSLMRADIGIAMGGIGSDSAIEASDVVIMDDDPKKIAKAIKIARKTIRIVKENISFSLIVKGICLLLGILGTANMWFAVFADVGVMIIAVLNAIRALKQ